MWTVKSIIFVIGESAFSYKSDLCCKKKIGSNRFFEKILELDPYTASTTCHWLVFESNLKKPATEMVYLCLYENGDQSKMGTWLLRT